MEQPIASDMRNVLITGLPRSGTTLVCHLLNKIPNAVALHEPLELSTLNGKSPTEMIDIINDFFKTERERILKTGRATSKSTGGVVPSNPLADSYVEGKRLKLIDGKEISVDNVHSPSFDLFIKHPIFFHRDAFRTRAIFPMLCMHSKPIVGAAFMEKREHAGHERTGTWSGNGGPGTRTSSGCGTGCVAAATHPDGLPFWKICRFRIRSDRAL